MVKFFQVMLAMCMLIYTSSAVNKRYRCSGNCPPGVHVTPCIVAPCQFAECGAHPSAKCCDDYCGGCNAYFYHQLPYNGKQWIESCN